MSNWVINVNDGQEVLTIDDGLYDVTVSDTFNPFGNYAKAWFDDLEGELFDLFRRGTKVSFQYNSDHTDGFTQRFVGFTVAELLNDSDGAEQLEVEAYTFDQFLRGGEVSNDQTGKTLFEALEDVITNDVPPVQWNASLVEVVDNVELTQSFEGDRVEDFLLEVRQKSAGELFGVTEDLEFSFGPAERTRTRRDIDNSQWFDHDIREESGETKNQVKVSYNDGDNTLIVDDTSDQLKLQDNLGAVGPGQDAASINRPEITNFEDAIDAGERFLEGREATLTGPVSTFELNDATPGQVISIEIEPRGIDTDFRIAENLIRWQSESNELTVVAKKGADDDILIEQSKTLQRVDKRPRDESVIPDRVTDTKPTAELPISVTADGVTADVLRVVNDGRNRIRDGIIDEHEIQSLQVEFSTTDSRPSRSDTDIANVIATDVPTVATDPQSVTYSASSTESDIQTIGIRDTDRDVLIAVARLESPVDSPSVDFTIDIANAGDDKSLFTETGLNLIRDILASTTPSWPGDYAYGSSDGTPQETDTSLTTEVARASLTEILVQSASSTVEWLNITGGFGDTIPLEVTNDRLKQLRTSDGQEGELGPGPDRENFTVTSKDTFSDGSAAVGFNTTDEGFLRYRISFPYDVPSEHVGVAIRDEIDETRNAIDPDTNEWSFNGVVLETVSAGEGASFSLSWVDLESGFYTTNPGASSYDELGGDDLVAGEEYVLEFRVDTSSDFRDYFIDYVVVFDKRVVKDPSEFDNEVHEPEGYLDDPEVFAESQEVDIEPVTINRQATEARIFSSWNNTDNNQFLELAIINDQFERTANSETANITVAESDADTTIQSRIGLSAFGGPRNETPRINFEGQEITEWELTANPDAITKDDIGQANVRAIIPESDALTETFAESGLFDSAGNLLTSCRVPEFQKDEHLVISSERLRFDND